MPARYYISTYRAVHLGRSEERLAFAWAMLQRTKALIPCLSTCRPRHLSCPGGKMPHRIACMASLDTPSLNKSGWQLTAFGELVQHFQCRLSYAPASKRAGLTASLLGQYSRWPHFLGLACKHAVAFQNMPGWPSDCLHDFSKHAPSKQAGLTVAFFWRLGGTLSPSPEPRSGLETCRVDR